MNVSVDSKAELYKGFAFFREHFGAYLISKLRFHYGDRWEDALLNSLSPAQRENWKRTKERNENAEALIDYSHFKPVILKHRELFRSDFGSKINNLPTWLDDIAEVRHKFAHFDEISQDEFDRTWIHMRTVSRTLKFESFEDNLRSGAPQRGVQRSRSKLESSGENPPDDVIREAVQKNPMLSLKMNTGREHRVMRSGIKGSLWVLPKREGYRVCTTGEAARLNPFIRGLCGEADKADDKGYLYWLLVPSGSLEKIIQAFSKL